MPLILCRMEYDVVLKVEGKTVAECGKLAKELGSSEADHAKLTTATLVKSLSDLPREWRDSIPYSDKFPDNLTCRQLLKKTE